MFKTGIFVVALSWCGVASSAEAAADSPATKTLRGEERTLPGGAALAFSKNAKYELGRPIKLQLAPTGSDKTVVQVIKLNAGNVSVSIPESKNPKTAVLIQAPRKVSAVAKGGQSLVIAAEDGVTVAAQKGEMLAALGNDWKALPSGLVRSFSAGNVTEQVVPAPPQLSVANSMLLALHGSVSTQVRATPDPLVQHRELALYRLEGNARVPVVEREWRSDAQQLPELSPGRYELTARAVDRFGVPSAASDKISLRVIGAELPEGAQASGATILLGRAGRVKLVGADGLEASYGRASLFVPVPKDVGLARGESTLLRLREPGKKDELGIRLEPRTLRANVDIGPRSARWPGDTLQVTVKLFDHRGRPMDDELKTKPQVFVNVGQVVPVWTHSGNTYSTRVAPASGAGPWVVRVEVNDDFGDPVGRDFIELGASRTASAN